MKKYGWLILVIGLVVLFLFKRSQASKPAGGVESPPAEQPVTENEQGQGLEPPPAGEQVTDQTQVEDIEKRTESWWLEKFKSYPGLKDSALASELASEHLARLKTHNQKEIEIC